MLDKYEENLILGALRTSGSFLIYGCVAEFQSIAELLSKEVGNFDSIEIGGGGDVSALSSQLEAAMKGGVPVVLHISGELSDELVRILSHAAKGEIGRGEEDPVRYEGTRLVAVSDEEKPHDSAKKAFDLHVSGMKVVRDLRAKQQKFEDDLAEAQERARESSRQHGLV